jgi:menaquinone-dependent protoporphyrinogen oxidase
LPNVWPPDVRDRGVGSRAIETAHVANPITWSRVSVALVGASIHIGRHQREAAAFVEGHAARLNGNPSAFFSVSLSAASRNHVEVARSTVLEASD